MSPAHLASAVLFALLTAASAIDIRTRRLPDWLNAIIFGCGLCAVWMLERSLLDSLIGAALGYGAIYALNALFLRARGHDAIGMGDAKLAAALGAWIGWFGLPFAALIAASLGLVFAAAARLMQGNASGAWREHALAFGPFLAFGGFIVWLALIYT
ncbi:MAG: A24 family peptidase [Hyphomonadaceae bacterium]